MAFVLFEMKKIIFIQLVCLQKLYVEPTKHAKNKVGTKCSWCKSLCCTEHRSPRLQQHRLWPWAEQLTLCQAATTALLVVCPSLSPVRRALRGLVSVAPAQGQGVLTRKLELSIAPPALSVPERSWKPKTVRNKMVAEPSGNRASCWCEEPRFSWLS